MHLVRFVTTQELQIYLEGHKIVNCQKHSGRGMKSTSVGACFAELTPERDPDKWLRKLFFVRPCQYCIEFDSDQFAQPLNESRATYASDDPALAGKGVKIEVREWWTTSYSLDTHPYIRIGKCPSLGDLCAGKKIEWIDPISILMAK